MNFDIPIVIIFILMLISGLLGVVVTRKLTPYMDSKSWTIRRNAFLLLAIAQAYGVWKTLWSDHHFNVHDFVFFGLLLIVFIGLDISNLILLRDWRRFPMFGRKKK